MKVLHLASGNRWTGAAAPAFAETEALREKGVDAHYAYVGGYKLEGKLGRLDFAHPIIGRAQNPRSFLRSVDAIERMLDHHRFDVLHAHLTWDHWLARFAARGRPVKIARTFHARRVLRSDPFTKSLVAHSDAVFVINATFRNAALIRDRRPIFTPPPVDRRQFTPDGPDARARYDIAPSAPLLAAIGKLSKGRGFEQVLETFAFVRRELANARLMIIGHGEHRPRLEHRARDLGVAEAVVWAGYHEDDLADHYRAADVLLFTARGSDEGHRAVLEAMACGIVPVAFPIDGLPALFGDLAPHLLAQEETPPSLALRALEVLQGDPAELQRRAYLRSDDFGYPRAAQRLMEAYASVQ